MGKLNCKKVYTGTSKYTFSQERMLSVSRTFEIQITKNRTRNKVYNDSFEASMHVKMFSIRQNQRGALHPGRHYSPFVAWARNITEPKSFKLCVVRIIRACTTVVERDLTRNIPVSLLEWHYEP